MSSYKVSVDEAIKALNRSEKRFVQLLQHGSMIVEYYAPKKIDPQMPHSQDELYIVISGSGNFVRGTETLPFNAGDVLFVPAGIAHRFENFSDDFATWVIFYGPYGGEK